MTLDPVSQIVLRIHELLLLLEIRAVGSYSEQPSRLKIQDECTSFDYRCQLKPGAFPVEYISSGNSIRKLQEQSTDVTAVPSVILTGLDFAYSPLHHLLRTAKERGCLT